MRQLCLRQVPRAEGKPIPQNAPVKSLRELQSNQRSTPMDGCPRLNGRAWRSEDTEEKWADLAEVVIRASCTMSSAFLGLFPLPSEGVEHPYVNQTEPVKPCGRSFIPPGPPLHAPGLDQSLQGLPSSST